MWDFDFDPEPFATMAMRRGSTAGRLAAPMTAYDPSATLAGCALLANPLALRVLDALVAEVAWYRHTTENSIDELTPAHRLTSAMRYWDFGDRHSQKPSRQDSR